jgi:hypothetical protein
VKRREDGLPYNHSTTSLTHHIKKEHAKEYEAAEKEDVKKAAASKPPSVLSFLTAPQLKWSKSSDKWKAATMALAKWCVKNTRPMQIVEDEGFIRFMALVKPEYTVPSADTITRYIEKLYAEVKSDIKEKLKEIEFCAKTTDGGSSSNAASFQETGVHGLTDDFEMVYFTLAVRECKEEHTAENYRKHTDKVEDEFGIREKVVLTTSDNEPKMRKAYKDEERTGCMSHLLHSSVSTGTSKEETVNNIVLKQRRIATKHNKSSIVKYGLKDAQAKIQIRQRPLLQDVVNRWGSTRVSTESILDHKDDEKEHSASDVFGHRLEGFRNAQAINEALRKHKFKNKEKMQDFLLTRTDMLRVKALHDFLVKFDVYSTTLGGNKFITSSIVMPIMKSIQKHLSTSEDEPTYISNMKEIILKDFKERTAKNLNYEFLIKASALDPRFRKLKFVDDKAMRELVFKKLQDEASEHVKELLQAEVQDEEKEGEGGPDEVKRRKLGLDYDESDEEQEEDDSAEDTIKREVDIHNMF